MATLHVVCGLPCTGKTRLAKELEVRFNALRLSPDEWHVGLFGQDIADPDHYVRHDWIEEKLQAMAFRCLALGIDVILDFGLWQRRDREAMRRTAAELGAASVLYFLMCDEDELMARLRLRNRHPDGDTFVIPEAHVRDMIARFEVPDELELRPRPPPVSA